MILYHIILYHIILYHIILYYIMLYYIVLYYVTLYHIILYCEQFDPCSGLSLLIVVPVMLVVQGNVTAWRSENGLFPRA